MSQKIEQWRNPGTEVRVLITGWFFKEPINSQYIEHPKSIWLLWNYLERVGFRAVVRKLRSRFSEQKRNQKIFGLGFGQIIEAPENVSSLLNKRVIFLAPNHSSIRKTIVLDKHFIELLSSSELGVGASNTTTIIDKLPPALQSYRAWSPYSGKEFDTSSIKQALAGISRDVKVNSNDKSNPSQEIIDHYYLPESFQSKPTAVLFGLGNYAKTAILPNIKPYIVLQRVHEVDPDQLAFLGSNPKVSLDTSPIPRDDSKFDAWFIAGFHHTHAELAIKGIEQGAYAVIEKPLATTMSQYRAFKDTLNNNDSSKFFLCFHKRYSKLHDYFLKDIGCRLGEPVDMHCIVYEIPLPEFHWYNWPNSGSRLISNGCHWIDYFMYTNDYSPFVEYRKWKPRGSDVVVQVRLENGAYFSMSLTDSGSQRLGVRDYIELRHGGITVTMNDGSSYFAENRNRVFNRKKINPLNAYARMYQKIAQSIASGDKGDDLKTLRSSELTLLVEGA